MENIYEYVRHPRAAELRASKPVKTTDIRRVDHKNPFVRFNARFGLWITLVVGTMWAAYLFTVLALFALPSAIHQGTYYIIVWLSSSFLQLVLLPIIIVGQNIQATAADKRSEDTYKDAEAVLKEAEEIQKHLLAQDQAISDIVERLEKLVGPAASA
jgi:type VI protein secretion system component VasK